MVILLLNFCLLTCFVGSAADLYAADNITNIETSEKTQSIDSTNIDIKRIWNLDNVDILALIGEISRVTGRNFVIDPRVTGKASLVSNEPMDNEQAYHAFLSILQVLGYAVVESGPVTKIVPSSVAKQFDTKVNVTNLDEIGDEMVVQVIAVKHVTATALIPILRNLVNQQGHIAPYSPSNVIVIADHASNVARIAEIIHRIDQENTDDVEIISLKDASADEVVKVLNNLLMRNQQLGEPVSQQIKMAADQRTNSVLLGGDKSKRLKMRALIAQMDVPTPRTGDTEVIYLKYQNSNDLVPVLASIIDAYYGKKSSGGYDSSLSGSNKQSTNGPSKASNYDSFGSSQSGESGGLSSGLELPDNKRGDSGGLSAPGVRAEPNTNSLVVTAPQELMRNIKSVINKLDIRRYQVLVEALIVEVSMEHDVDLGIEWRLPHHEQGFGGGTSFPNSGSGLINDGNKTSPLLQSLPLSGMTIGFLRGGDIRAILYALGKDKNTNILSTPSLVTMDNETAEIVVADKIPFKTSDVSSLDNETNTRNTFEYRNVGLNLKITPMITKGDAVKLAIAQTTGTVTSTGETNTPSTAERSIKTVVAVDNKDVLVLGGLIQAQKEAVESKVPILGDIPLIGHLFKRTTSDLSKRNLMVFIRPVIIRTQEESHNLSFSKYDMMRDSQLLYKLDPYAKIAKEMMPELPDLDKKYSQNNKSLDLPGPFSKDTFSQKISRAVDVFG